MAVKHPRIKRKELAAENEELRVRLEEAEETLRAIRSGEVDALIVSTTDGEQVFTLQGADRSYRLLIENMNEGALSLTGDGMILYANQRFAGMLKTSLEKVIGSSIHSWIVRDSQKALQELLRKGTHQLCREELTLAAADGTRVTVYLAVNPLSGDGMADSLGVVATDLTVQKIAERALRISEGKFRNLFERSPLGKYLVSMDGDVKVNKAYCEILGYSEEEFRSKSWQEITYPDDVPATEKVIQKLLDGTLSSARFEKRYIHKGGGLVWTDATMDIQRDGAGKPLYILTAIIDITARKQADAALFELKQHLQRNIEMERLRLSQDLHDIPLQELYAVIYNLEDLRGRSDSDSAAILAHAIDDIQKTLNSLRSVASELRPQAISRFGLEKAIRSYIEDFQEKHPQIRIRHSLAQDDQLLPESVRLVLFRVLQESLANVARHSEATEIRVGFNFDAEEARIEISDNGQGFRVPANWVGMVREGHYGLAGMAERVSGAGGILTIESVPGASTAIRVVVPCTLT